MDLSHYPPAPKGRIVLPKQFLPCVDDHHKLAVVSDYLEEHGADPGLVGLCRWVSLVWREGWGLKREQHRLWADVWVRQSKDSWRTGFVTVFYHSLTDFPPRPTGAVSVLCPGLVVPNSARVTHLRRAWWDLWARPPGDLASPKLKSPYTPSDHLRLARALVGGTTNHTAALA